MSIAVDTKDCTALSDAELAEMAGRALNVRRALDLAVQMADAVADAHAAGFIHGGLSPDAVVVTAKGHAKIPAFELAAPSGFEQTGGGIRLRDYDSPEEARGERPDEPAVQGGPVGPPAPRPPDPPSPAVKSTIATASSRPQVTMRWTPFRCAC